MASTAGIEIEKFNGQNFELWKLKMEDLLVDQEQWIVVDPGRKPTATLQDDWDKLERRERSTIQFFLSDSVLLNVSGEDSEVKLWEKLGSLYQSKSLVNKLFLQKKWFHLRMDENETVIEHLECIRYSGKSDNLCWY